MGDRILRTSVFESAVVSEPEAASEILDSFLIFAKNSPDSAEILRNPDGISFWQAWDDLADDLKEVFAAADSPYSRITQRGSDAGLSLVEGATERSVTLPTGGTSWKETAADEAARELAARWAEVNGVKLVGLESSKTAEAVWSLIAAALRGEESLRTAARAMMSIKGFGLDPYRQGILLRKIERWQSNGVSKRTVARRARKERKRLLFRRAKDIWGFQSRSAIFEGARIGWSEARRQGLITPNSKLIWVHPIGAGEGHPCPRCEALIGTTVEIHEDFKSRPVKGGGRNFNGKVLVRRRPPEHSRCDCELDLAI